MKRLPVALTGALAFLFAASAQAQSNRVVTMQQLAHEEMVAVIPVDPEVARSKVPAEYELELAPDGSALLIFVTKVSTWTPLADAPFFAQDSADTKEVHVYVLVQGPFQVIEVPGAPVTIPSSYLYSLFFEVDGPGWFVGGVRSFGLDIRKPEQLELDPFGPEHGGSLVERGAKGQGYRWTVYTEPAEALYGQHNFFYRDKNPGRHTRFEGSILFNQVGLGYIVLETDPGSSLADFGPLLVGEATDYAPVRDVTTMYNE